MSFNSYNLPYTTMVNLMNMVNANQIKIVGLPKRNELTEIQRFIKDYMEYRNSK